KFHREMDALELATGDVEVARLLGAAGEQDGIEAALQVADRMVHADVRAGDELDAFGAHLIEAAIDQVLLHFEVRYTVAEKAADAVVLFVDGDFVAGARELMCDGECGRYATQTS